MAKQRVVLQPSTTLTQPFGDPYRIYKHTHTMICAERYKTSLKTFVLTKIKKELFKYSRLAINSFLTYLTVFTFGVSYKRISIKFNKYFK